MPHAIEIERLVQWAYIELLKRGTVGTLAQAWDQVSGYGELLTLVDERPNSDLRMPAGAGVMHPDAVTIERAVQGLAGQVKLDWRVHRVLILGELGAFAGDGDPLAGRAFDEVALVETFARMGTRPRWDIGQPIVKRAPSANNRGVVLQGGRSKGNGRYDQGTACALRLEPSIERIAYARVEYFVWRAALERLVGILKGWTLTDHAPLPPTAPAEPWLPARPSTSPTPNVIRDAAPAWRAWEPIIKKRKGKATSLPAV